jgi:hypothetical protein
MELNLKAYDLYNCTLDITFTKLLIGTVNTHTDVRPNLIVY